MTNAESPFIERLVDQEIRSLVAEAMKRGSVLSTSECVRKVRLVYPTCSLSKLALSNKVIKVASSFGVPVEIGLGTRAAISRMLPPVHAH